MIHTFSRSVFFKCVATKIRNLSERNTSKDKEKKERNMNCRWHEIIEAAAYCCQSNFSKSKILAQLLEFNDVLSRKFQEKSVVGDDNFFSKHEINSESLST